MEAFSPTSGLALMFALGLRHGFDPDHIAMIDSMAYRILPARARLAPWVGTLFALGHGLAVTVIAVALGTFACVFELPVAARVLLDWLPTVLLVLVGTLNLRSLLERHDYRPRGWKVRFVPARLRDSSHPLSILAVGMLFALVFDTATQAAAWGFAAAAGGGSGLALAAGLAFTAGMVVTDTADGRLMVRLLRRTSSPAGASAYRRWIGWGIVFMSYSMAAYEVGTWLRPEAALNDAAMTALGCALFVAALLAYGVERRRQSPISPLSRDPS
jgi:high-affinity nickel-transport protein